MKLKSIHPMGLPMLCVKTSWLGTNREGRAAWEVLLTSVQASEWEGTMHHCSTAQRGLLAILLSQEEDGLELLP